MTLHYLGPAGTFSEQAAAALGNGAARHPQHNHRAVLRAVDADPTATGVIALENSREGLVPGSLIDLIHETSNCLIRAEHVLPVRFAVLRRPDDTAYLAGVAAHGMALGQCTQFIAEHELETKSVSSNAAACQLIATEPEPGWGALGPVAAASRYGLRVEAECVGDDPEAVTRFVLVGHTCPPPTGRDRTALAVEPSVTEIGSLVRVIQEFNARGMNMLSIKSVPSRGLLGTDLFFLECPGHIAEPQVRHAVSALLAHGVPVRFLGSFPEDAQRPCVDAAARCSHRHQPGIGEMLERIVRVDSRAESA